MLTDVFAHQRIFITGHTGFKGAWLCEWLLQAGADIWGYSLPAPTEPALFEQLDLGRRIRHHQIGDVRDLAAVRTAVETCQPDFVFHLAAQSLVRVSYEQPVETYATNVLGTVHVLEALRRLKKPCAAVMVTTDKCYENFERNEGYREEDPLGGHDPYSSSKAAAEIAIASYRRSFFPPARLITGDVPPVAVASARAGNVIGGGDWAQDRIVPDCMRALARDQAIRVRNPRSTRPWQHVLEPLSGYLSLAAQMRSALLDRSSSRLAELCTAFNFGPARDSNRTVREVVEEIVRNWPGDWEDHSDPKAVHEAALLHLVTDKAQRVLGWQPRWAFAETVQRTVQWYRTAADPGRLAATADFTRRQIADYSA